MFGGPEKRNLKVLKECSSKRKLLLRQKSILIFNQCFEFQNVLSCKNDARNVYFVVRKKMWNITKQALIK